MKIRNDFVTNSSSSSYLISFKEPENYSDKKWFDLLLNFIVEAEGYETNKGIVVKSSDKIEEFFRFFGVDDKEEFLDLYTEENWKLIENCLNEGKTLVAKDIGYDDEGLTKFLYKLDGANLGIKIEYENG